MGASCLFFFSSSVSFDFFYNDYYQPPLHPSTCLLNSIYPLLRLLLFRCAAHVATLDRRPAALEHLLRAPRVADTHQLAHGFAWHPDVPGHAELAQRLRLLLAKGLQP